ncbi:hypothetical protein ES703_21626 [subsurface metagenome]
MARVIFYPLGNADCCLIRTDMENLFVFDFADMRAPEDEKDKRMPLADNLKDDIGWPNCKEVDVLAVTHGDIDHVKGIPNTFWLHHAEKYQGDDRVKIKELWVPAALIVEEGSEDDSKIVRAEARHRFLKKSGIRVFARPEHLKDWLQDKGKKLSDYLDLICDAGRLVPNWDLQRNGIEFFPHSPFAERTENGILDRNGNCLVMQAVIRSGGRDTRLLTTADSVSDEWSEIISITRAHQNQTRLEWDIFKIPHHCSYLSMADEKGTCKTMPTTDFTWLLEQGAQRGVMVSTSDPIPNETIDQPPHVETYRRYKDTADELDAELVVTMQHPTQHTPKRTIIDLDSNGPTLKKESSSAAFSVISKKSPRVG